MPKVLCPNCAARLEVPAQFQGRKAKCKKCGKVFTIEIQPEQSTLEPEADIEEGVEVLPPSVFRPAAQERPAASCDERLPAQPIDAFGLAALGIATAIIAFVPTEAAPAGAAVCSPFLAIGIGRAVDRRRLPEIIVTAATTLLLGISIGLYKHDQAKAADEAAQSAKKVQDVFDILPFGRRGPTSR
jgi:hypothetical protein